MNYRSIPLEPGYFQPPYNPFPLDFLPEGAPRNTRFETFLFKIARGQFLKPLVSQYPDEGRICHQDPSVRSGSVNADRGVFEQGTVALLALAQRLLRAFALGDVVVYRHDFTTGQFVHPVFPPGSGITLIPVNRRGKICRLSRFPYSLEHAKQPEFSHAREHFGHTSSDGCFSVYMLNSFRSTIQISEYKILSIVNGLVNGNAAAHMLKQFSMFLFALPQRHLRPLALGDVLHQAYPPRLLPLMVSQGRHRV